MLKGTQSSESSFMLTKNYFYFVRKVPLDNEASQKLGYFHFLVIFYERKLDKSSN